MTVTISPELGQYLGWAIIFIAGYHIAYLFKNYSRLMQQQGLLMFLFTFAWMFAVIAVVVQNVEQLASWPITLAYTAGFFLRFFKDDL